MNWHMIAENFDQENAPEELKHEIDYHMHDIGGREYEYTLADALEDIDTKIEDANGQYLGRKSIRHIRDAMIKAKQVVEVDMSEDVYSNNRLLSKSGRTLFIQNGIHYEWPL